MARWYVGRTEWYPVLTLDDDCAQDDWYEPDCTDVPDELVERYGKNLVEFDQIQSELRALLKEE